MTDASGGSISRDNNVSVSYSQSVDNQQLAKVALKKTKQLDIAQISSAAIQGCYQLMNTKMGQRHPAVHDSCRTAIENTQDFEDDTRAVSSKSTTDRKGTIRDKYFVGSKVKVKFAGHQVKARVLDKKPDKYLLRLWHQGEMTSKWVGEDEVLQDCTSDNEIPITDVCLIYSNQPIPEGYEPVDFVRGDHQPYFALRENSKRKFVLCYRRSETDDCVTDIQHVKPEDLDPSYGLLNSTYTGDSILSKGGSLLGYTKGGSCAIMEIDLAEKNDQISIGRGALVVTQLWSGEDRDKQIDLVIMKDMSDCRYEKIHLKYLPTLKYFDPLLVSLNLRDLQLAQIAQKFLKFLILENFLHYQHFGQRILVSKVVDRCVRCVTQALSINDVELHKDVLELMVILTQKYVTVISVESIWDMCLASTRLMLVERKDETYPCQYSKKLLEVSLKYLQKFQRNRLATDDYSTYQHSGIEIATELIQDLVQRVVDVREISREFYKFYDAELYSPECKEHLRRLVHALFDRDSSSHFHPFAVALLFVTKTAITPTKIPKDGPRTKLKDFRKRMYEDSISVLTDFFKQFEGMQNQLMFADKSAQLLLRRSLYHMIVSNLLNPHKLYRTVSKRCLDFFVKMVTTFGHFSIWEIRAVLCKVILPALESNLTPISNRCNLLGALTLIVQDETFVKDVLYNLDVVQKELVFDRLIKVAMKTVQDCSGNRHKQAQQLNSDELSDNIRKMKTYGLKLIEKLFKTMVGCTASSKRISAHRISEIRVKLEEAKRHRTLIQEHLEICKNGEKEKGVHKAIKAFIAEGVLPKAGAAVANFLLEHLHIIHPVPMGEFVAGTRPPSEVPFEEECRQAFCRRIPVSPLMPLEQAFEHFNSYCGMRIPGESQKIERALESFSIVFCDLDERKHIDNPSDLYTVFFAMLMVHSSWHNKNIRPSDRCDENFFVTGCSACPGARYTESDLKRMFTYISQNEFPPPERNLLDTEQIEKLILGWPPDEDMKSFRDSQYELYCRNASDRALHCIRESIFRNSNLENSHAPAYFWHMLTDTVLQGDIIKIIEVVLDNPVRSTAPVALKICEFVIRLSSRLDIKNITERFTEIVCKWWNKFRPKENQVSYDLLQFTMESNGALISETMQTMIDRWVEADELKALEKVQAMWGETGFQPNIVEPGRMFETKRRVFKVDKQQQKKNSLKGDVEEYELFIFNDIIVWVQFHKAEGTYKFGKDERQTLLLAFCKIRDVPDEDRIKNAFEVDSCQERVMFSAPSPEEKIKIIQLLNYGIQQAKGRIRTICSEISEISTQLYKKCQTTSAFLGRRLEKKGNMINTTVDNCKLCLRKFNKYQIKKSANRCPACDAYICQVCYTKNKRQIKYPASSNKKKTVCDACFAIITDPDVLI